MSLPIYLDYASTTPVDPSVAESMMEFMTPSGHFGNPASRSHMFGWSAEAAVEEAREDVANLINSDPREIVWTSGATEANNLAIKGCAHFNVRKGKHIITSKIEHKDPVIAGLSKKYGNIIESGTKVLESLENYDTISVSPVLDLALGGGLREGQCVVMTGDPKTGKTTTALYAAAKAQAKSNDQDLSLTDFKDENEVGFEQHEQEVADKKARATDIFNKIKDLRDNKSKASAYFGSRAGRKKLEELRALQNSRRPIVESASNIDPSETSAGKAFLDSLQKRQVFGDISAGR